MITSSENNYLNKAFLSPNLFGVDQGGGTFATGVKYRYGFNGMEKDDEVKGSGNSYTTLFRQYDPRIGRWLSLDPLMAKYPHQSPYAAFNNNPIYFADPTGLEGEDKNETGADGNTLTLPEQAVVTSRFKKDINYTSGSGSNKIKVTPEVGSIRSFEVNGQTYTARYYTTGKNKGKFAGYKSKGDNESYDLTTVKARIKVAEEAQKLIDNTEYAVGVEKSGVDEGSWKCNIFVYETLEKANVEPEKSRIMNPTEVKYIPFADPEFGPPLANDWANENYKINGWRILGPEEKPIPGDVVALPRKGNSGHVQIVISSSQSVGAGRYKVKASEWGMNGKEENTKVIYRRYVGK